MSKFALSLCALLVLSQVPALAQTRSQPVKTAPAPKTKPIQEEIPTLEPLNSPPPAYDSFSNSNNGNLRSFDVAVSRLAANTYLPSVPSPNQGALYLDPNGEKPVSVFTSNDIYDTNNQVAIPRGSEIRGRFTPVRGGLKFQADAVVVKGQYYPLQASSDTLFDEKDPREYSGEAIAGDALIGAGAGALLGALTGGISWGGLLGGAAASSLIGNVTAPRVVVVSPDRPLNIRLETPLTLRR